MRVAGIIAEYNPMHNGHIYHLEKTKEISRADFVVAVMSGDFTQRGKPAVLDKWERSRIAVLNGVDLVLEMPFVYATGSAPDFAFGGVGILEGLGIVDTISFGSESADADELTFMADFLKNESPEFRAHLKKHLDMGLSFPAARQIAVNECLGMDAGKLLKTPNDILAVEYLKHVRTMTPVAVKRQGSYSSAELPCEDLPYVEHSVSARAIRRAVKEGRISEICSFVPEETYDELLTAHERAFRSDEKDKEYFESKSLSINNISEKYFDMLRAVILSSEKEELANIRGMQEGMENKIKKEVRLHADYDSFAGALKSKRYTRTNIDRLLLHVLCGLKKKWEIKPASDDPDDGAGREKYAYRDSELYARVLAFNPNGSRLLKKASEVCSIPIITNINKYEHLPDIVKYDIKSSDIYNLLAGKDLYGCSDHVRKPFHI